MALARQARKHDNGKPKFGLLPWDAIGEIARVFAWAIDNKARGKKAYKEGEWKYVENAEKRYVDAAMRHLGKHSDGITIDEESNLPSLAHAGASVVIAIWHHIHGSPKKGWK